MKNKLEKHKWAWIDKLPKVFWAYQTSTSLTAIEETTFTMAFGIEAVILAEMDLPSYRVENFDEENNAE